MKGGKMTKLDNKSSMEDNDSGNDGNTKNNSAKDYFTSLNSYKKIA